MDTDKNFYRINWLILAPITKKFCYKHQIAEKNKNIYKTAILESLSAITDKCKPTGVVILANLEPTTLSHDEFA